MKRIQLTLLLLAGLTALAQSDNAKSKQLIQAAESLGGMSFDTATVTVRGRVSTLIWPEGGPGMMLIETIPGREQFAFSTARVPAMAQQGFTRRALGPGAEVIVTGVLAKGNASVGPGFQAARADLITKSDGTRVFDRTRLPVGK